MNTLVALLKELEKQIPLQEIKSPSISSGTVGWHIEHTLMVLNKVIDAVVKSNSDEYKWTFNVKRLYVLTLNKIPRGKVKAPTSVRPENFTTTSLTDHLQIVMKKVSLLKELSPKQYFEHPFLQKLNRNATIKFLKIHTQHHLAIIKDIITYDEIASKQASV